MEFFGCTNTANRFMFYHPANSILQENTTKKHSFCCFCRITKGNKSIISKAFALPNAQPLASYNKCGTAKEKFARPITSWQYQ